MKNDTGESVAAINARRAKKNWPLVAEQLRAGAVLVREPGLPDYYTKGSAPGFYRYALPRSFVARLWREGNLQLLGMDMYGLKERSR